MSILVPLVKAYNAQGFAISSGLNPCLFANAAEAPSTWLLKDGQSVTEGLGIGFQEVYFLEMLCNAARPRRIYIIGNSFGFSTIALSLMNPQARTVAIDSGYDHNAREGINLTNRIGRALSLDVEAVIGSSPDDVPRTVNDHLGGPIDLAFVDGLHTNEQVVKDAAAIAPFLSDHAVVVFHDVVSFRLEPGMAEIAGRLGIQPRTMWATPSGLAVLSRDRSAAVADVLDIFAGVPEGLALVRAKAEADASHRRFHRLKVWKRSVMKRLGRRAEERSFHKGAIG